MSSGCPKCGSERLKSALLFGVDRLARLVSTKHRNTWAACGWPGWHRRLWRRNNDVSSLTSRWRALRRAYVSFVLVAPFLTASGAMLFREIGAPPRASVEGTP